MGRPESLVLSGLFYAVEIIGKNIFHYSEFFQKNLLTSQGKTEYI